MPRLLEQVRAVIRLKHYSIRTEEAYTHWIKEYILFHRKQHPSMLGAEHVSQFLSYLAENRHVASSTQNQATSALLFLYREVLEQPLPGSIKCRKPESRPDCPSSSHVMRRGSCPLASTAPSG
jgi:hypothetical protein